MHFNDEDEQTATGNSDTRQDATDAALLLDVAYFIAKLPYSSPGNYILALQRPSPIKHSSFRPPA